VPCLWNGEEFFLRDYSGKRRNRRRRSMTASGLKLFWMKYPRVRRIIGCHHSRVDDMVPKLIACLSSKGRLAGVRLQNR
jgi:hypothetical protein